MVFSVINSIGIYLSLAFTFSVLVREAEAYDGSTEYY